MKKGNRTFGKILMVLTLAFFYLPILYMIIFSFNAGKSLTVFTGFSMRWYQHMLDSKDMMEALYTTFTVAIRSMYRSYRQTSRAAAGNGAGVFLFC